MKTHPFKDSRYTITKEFCGYKEPRFVARFCQDYIGQSMFYQTAVLMAAGHKARRQGALIVENMAA